MTPPNDVTGLRNYQLLAGLGLGMLFLVQLQQTSLVFGPVRSQIALLADLVMLLFGVFAILGRRASDPLLVLLLLAGTQLLIQGHLRVETATSMSRANILNPLDLALALAALAYFGAQYRVRALHARPLPRDPRQKRQRLVSPTTVAPAEVVGLLLSLPAFALGALALAYATAGRDFADLPAPVTQLLSLTWGLLLGVFVVGFCFQNARWRRLDAMSARLLLQDILWTETRGEQRRLNRWLAWKSVRTAASVPPKGEG